MTYIVNGSLIDRNKKKYSSLNIPIWHEAGITGEGVRIAVIGYGGCLPHKKPYLTNVNPNMGGSYHDGDAIIHDVAPDSKIFGLNMMDKNGWSMEQCLEWCINNDIDIICTSIRMIHFNSENKRLSKELYNKGVIMIDSSDNKGSEDIGYPAADPHWLCIGSYDGDGGRAGYSSYGKHLDCLMYTNFGVEAQENYYVEISHTSGSTQVVAGMAALLKEHMNITPDEFREFIKENSIDLGKPGWDKETGHGLFILPKKIPERKEEIELNKPQYIIIHHSGTKNGNADIFRRSHKARGWRDVGYHYIIGNGTQSGDGEVEIGRTEAEDGAHCRADGMNRKSIGICLVGDFDKQKPTPAQMEALERLCRDIMTRHKIPPFKILGHGEVAGANTACPGKNFDINAFRKELVKMDKKDYEGHWAKASIEKAKASGVMSGYPDGTFKPDQPVTRAELAVILDRLGLLEVR